MHHLENTIPIDYSFCPPSADNRAAIEGLSTPRGPASRCSHHFAASSPKDTEILFLNNCLDSYLILQFLRSTCSDWSRFKKIRKHIKSKLREFHDDYISDILDLGSLDEQGTQPKPTIGKKFWSYIRAQKRDTVGIPLPKVGQRHITDSVKKAEALSNQYEFVFTDENLTAMLVMTRHRIEGIDNLVVTTNGVRNLLINLNPKKANGPDLLPIRVLKEAASETAPILQVIYSVSLQQGHAPHDWRSANIVPVYKKDDRHCPANYRPVSLTPVSCKLLEHIVYKHIMRHCETHDIIVDIQHGLRSGRS